jgi:hypothetical protein
MKLKALSVLSVSTLALAPLVVAAPAEADSPTCSFTYNSSQFVGHCSYSMNPQPSGGFYYTFTLCGSSGSCTPVSTTHVGYGYNSVWNFSAGSGYGGGATPHTYQG